MNFSHYLPKTKERLNRLRGIIDRRPVAIMLVGVSIVELEQRITELKDCDICYCGVNWIEIVEKYILSKIGRRFSIAMCSATPWYELDYTFNFLERKERNMLISTQRAFDQSGRSELIEKYDKKLLFYGSIFGPGYQEFFEVPSEEYPLHFPMINSLSDFICLLTICGASRIVLFGADGGRISKDAVNYRESECAFPTAELDLIHDTLQLNMSMETLLERVYKTYSLMPVDIINCSTKSHYDVFSKLSYPKTLALLRRKK